MSMPTDLQAATTVGDAVEMTYRDAVNAALDDALAEDPAVVFMGEDVGNEGGVYKTCAGLPDKYGERVINTPICENGFTSVALGMAVMGMRPIVEFMFADFMPTAGDAIVNQLAKYRFMSGGQLSAPVTLRVVSGAGSRFGTQHSASGESWFMGQPGLRVAAAGTPAAAYELIRAGVRSNDPTIVHEHKLLYLRKGPVHRGAIAAIGKASVERQGSDATIVATMLMVQRALQAAAMLQQEEGIDVEVIDLRWVRPIDLETIIRSVERTGRLLVAEEQPHAGGWGATVISRLAMAGTYMVSRPRSIAMPDDIPVPFAGPLEDAVMPSVDRIAEEVRGSLRS
jgi:acetoin:2,6-dichlorophenolindophenol oxidoreductase subunit beta